MDEKRICRALSWAGGGGSVLAVSALVAAGLVGATPDGGSAVAHLTSCSAAGCTSASTRHAAAPAKTTKKAATHVGRVTYPEARGVNSRVPAPTPTTVAQAPAKPAPVTWTTSLPAQHLDAPIMAMASLEDGSLLMAGSDGGVFPIGRAGFAGSLGGHRLASSIVAVAADPVGGGYWLAGRDGGVFGFGGAPFKGSLSGTRLSSPVVAMAPAPSGHGYWLASADGGVFGFGGAPFKGSLSGTRLSSPVVAMASTPSGHGYWLVSADGGVFGFGDAVYKGSLSGARLSSPVVAMASTPSGHGYWLVAKDGGVFGFGDAPYKGSLSGARLPAPVTAIVGTPSGHGYWLAEARGEVKAFGDAQPVTVTVPPGTVVATSATRPAPPARSDAARPAQNHAAARPARRPHPPAPVVASGPTDYRRGTVGYDISQYQCGNIPPGPAAVSVVQVTGGSIGTPNPCYVNEARWAGPRMSAYIYMNGLPNPAPAASLSGPAGNCTAVNVACQSYNFGFNYVRYWVSYSRSVGVNPSLWWIDVERYSGWRDSISNRLVIHGALDGLKSMHVSTGVYSSPSQWQEITGGMDIHGEPVWTPGAGSLSGPGYTATNFCAAPGKYSFGGGRLRMVQFGYQGPFPGSFAGATAYDLDLAC